MVMAYAVSSERQRSAIKWRLELERRCISSILGQALRLAAAGIVIGLGLSLALTRLVASQLIGISATEFDHVHRSATTARRSCTGSEQYPGATRHENRSAGGAASGVDEAMFSS